MKLHIIDEAERCLKCKKPLCQQGCPIHTPIPQITQLLLENRLMEAGEILFANNPMCMEQHLISPSILLDWLLSKPELSQRFHMKQHAVHLEPG